MVQKKNFKNMNRFYHEHKTFLDRKKVWFLEFNAKDNDYELTRFDDLMRLMQFCEQISDLYGSDLTYFRVWEVDDYEGNTSRFLRHKFFNKNKLIEKDYDEGANYEKY